MHVAKAISSIFYTTYKRRAQNYIVMINVSHVEVFFNVFVTKHYGAPCPIVNCGLAAHAGELETDWVLQLKYRDTRSLDIVGGDHHSLASAV